MLFGVQYPSDPLPLCASAPLPLSSAPFPGASAIQCNVERPHTETARLTRRVRPTGRTPGMQGGANPPGEPQHSLGRPYFRSLQRIADAPDCIRGAKSPLTPAGALGMLRAESALRDVHD